MSVKIISHPPADAQKHAPPAGRFPHRADSAKIRFSPWIVRPSVESDFPARTGVRSPAAGSGQRQAALGASKWALHQSVPVVLPAPSGRSARPPARSQG